MKAFLVCFALLRIILCRDDFTITFIKSFIKNEGKPTQLITAGLCWTKRSEVRLVSEISKHGVMWSSSFKSKSTYHDQSLLFLVDLYCPTSENVLLYATSQKLFQFPFRWLILSTGGVNPANIVLGNLSILSDSDLVLAENIGGEFLLTELYRPSMNHSIQSKPRGYYNGTLIDVRQHKELFRRRRDLMGHPLTMANVIQESNDTKKHLLKQDRLDLQHDAAPKLCWIAATHAFEMLNATPRYIFSYRWGYKVNGRWSGMIDDIWSGRADLGTNCFAFADRLDVVAYTDMVAPLRTRFIFRQPPLTSVSNIFSLPFSTSVWVALVACVAASTLTLYLTSKWEVTLESGPSQLDGSMGDALLLTLSAVAQQGCFIEPRRASGRIMEWFLFTALMALYAAYSANIVVLLQAPSNSIRSLTHLSASKLTLAALDVDYSSFLFSGKSTTDARTTLLQYIFEGWERRQDAIGIFCVLSVFDCVSHDTLLRKSGHYGVSIKSGGLIKVYLSDKIQKVVINKTEFADTPLVVGVPQGSILVDRGSNCLDEVNSALWNVLQWFTLNNLSVNSKNTKFIKFSVPNGHKDPVHVTIAKKVMPENEKPQFYSINDGVERIRLGMFALHSIVEPIYRRIEDTFLETEKCDLTEVDYINGFDAFLPVRKTSPYLELIRVVFKQIRESGIQSALIKRLQVPKPRCSNKMSAFSSVGLLDLGPVLIFMLYGAALSIVILIAEIIYFKM
ncbi:unnamed protein product [Chilo suppressalis]|uniref:Ionotropic glutamate receptor C-terminal domain-containing protein n=1 Tax=Chilo suppressalis TaxID=168631 RepID=A0ABN8B5R7_CHISP|nr:unnamed protein product [Chilo suppressalis]